ncbi:hypothetical protein [Actinomadura rudentiformis]|uniref:UDP-N-acetylglucosamine 2-epimerase domain-containing protein n=1 Tax=Actinomadura rudentiformis TaxID=359158 RepID=A0A6H9ZB64_9ACTN|nr:hypothetical protein [Actinomadura rudentiformis]KAB2351562.1 hypothetical protein F8566_04860 [Actinomadura rudentiformis]
MTVQLFTCASAPVALAMAAAIDAGMLGAASRTPIHRILLVSDETAIPEFTPSLRDTPGFAAAAERFTQILSWNETVAPAHPASWTPRSEDRPMFERMLRREWNLGNEPIELVLGSATSAQSRALATIFRSAPVIVCTASPEVYAPTPAALPTGMSSRIERLLHLDLVPGLAPHLLGEYGIPAEVIPPDAYRTLLTEAAANLASPTTGTALIIGTEHANTNLTMLRGVAANGHKTIVYAPSPETPTWSAASLATRLSEEAEALGVRLLPPTGLPATGAAPTEVLCAALAPDLLVGCDVSALLATRRHLGIPTAYASSETFPSHANNEQQLLAVIVAHLLPQLSTEGTLAQHAGSARAQTSGPAQTRTGDLSQAHAQRGSVQHGGPAPGQADGAVRELGALVTAVSYCLRPGSRPDLRADAVAYLERQVDSPYFRRERLAELGLPGGEPPPVEEPVAPPPEPVARKRGRITTRLLRSG